MQRDWDFIRDLLIDIEGNTDPFPKHRGKETEEKFLYHVRLLTEEGCLIGIKACQGVGGSWTYLANNARLSWSGHDILETLRAQTTWQRIKNRSAELGIPLTTDAIKTIGAWVFKNLVDGS